LLLLSWEYISSRKLHLFFQFEDALDGTDLDAHGFIVMSLAFNAGFGINNIDLLTLSD